MDICLDPVRYLQNTFNGELQQIFRGNSNESFCGLKGFQVKRKPSQDGDVHVPAFTRQINPSLDTNKEQKFDGHAVVERLSSSPTLSKYIKNINISSNGQLNVCLNKTTVIEEVIKNVTSKGDQYGKQAIFDESTAFPCTTNVNTNPEYVINGGVSLDIDDSNHGLSSLDSLRIIITLGHVKNILMANGLSVNINNLVLPEDIISKSQSNLEAISLFDDTLITKSELNTDYQRTFKDMQLTLLKSHYVSKKCDDAESAVLGSCYKNKNSPISSKVVEESEDYNEDQLLLYFDCQQYRKKCNLHHVNITRALVHKVSALEYNARINDTKGNSCHLLHITSSKKLYASQQHGMVWEALSSSPLAKRQMYMSLAMISVHDNQHTCTVQGQVGIKDLLRIREGQLRAAYLLKYGDLVEGAGWDSSIRSVAIATIKLQIMSAAQNNQVRIDITKEAQDFRQSTFVMYNCARLAKLFHHYEKSVEQGLYHPLPEVDKIDFSLLREKDEWNLLLRYVMTFPSALRDAVRGLLAKPRHDSLVTTNINKICCFLHDLSQDFSSYYGRTHVLCEPRPHLFPTMFARLYLLKAIQQFSIRLYSWASQMVFHNGLALLDIQPLTQM